MVDRPAFPTPGQLFDIGTHRMHLYSMGEGSPTVVLDSGSGDTMLSWDAIQPEIAKFTRVVSYDRSGMGWSERGPNPFTARGVAEELHKLLEVAEVAAPFILVGHSLGGVYMRHFAQLYPHLVSGLVLIDSSHESQSRRFDEAIPAFTVYNTTRMEYFLQLSQRSHEEILEAIFKLSTRTEPPSDLEMRIFDRMRPSQLALLIEEVNHAGTDSLNQPDDAIPSLGDLNLTVLTATRAPRDPAFTEDESQQLGTLFQSMQTEITGRSTRSKQVFVEAAGHYIHHDQPQVVLDAIHEMVKTVRQDMHDAQ